MCSPPLAGGPSLAQVFVEPEFDGFLHKQIASGIVLDMGDSALLCGFDGLLGSFEVDVLAKLVKARGFHDCVDVQRFHVFTSF